LFGHAFSRVALPPQGQIVVCIRWCSSRIGRHSPRASTMRALTPSVASLQARQEVP
jgi:hypothetical protein